jgi:DUF4097 and DUF4098 domain-containing protein YvlB
MKKMIKHNHMKCVILVFSIVLLMVSFTGCVFRFGDTIYQYTDNEYNANTNTILTVSTINGAIDISSYENDTISLHIIKTTNERWGEDEFNKVTVDVRESNNNLIIETIHLETQVHVSVSFIIKVPEFITIDSVQTSNGPIDISGIEGDSISLLGSNGPITASDINGDIQASTSNGPITLNKINGYVETSSSNGQITINGAKGVNDLSTSNGPISVEILDFQKDIDIITSNGPITVHLNTELNANIELKTSPVSGKIVLHDFADYLDINWLDSNHIKGTLGNGGNNIYIETSNGSIHLYKLV